MESAEKKRPSIKIAVLFCALEEMNIFIQHIQQIQKDIPPKMFLETLNLFAQFEFTEKGNALPNFVWSRDVAKTINIVSQIK